MGARSPPYMPVKSAHAFKAGFFVGMGQIGGVIDYSRMRKAQLIEEIAALQEKVAELERTQAERLSAEQAGKRAEGE
jgi:hypothetical protein